MVKTRFTLTGSTTRLLQKNGSRAISIIIAGDSDFLSLSEVHVSWKVTESRPNTAFIRSDLQSRPNMQVVGTIIDLVRVELVEFYFKFRKLSLHILLSRYSVHNAGN